MYYTDIMQNDRKCIIKVTQRRYTKFNYTTITDDLELSGGATTVIQPVWLTYGFLRPTMAEQSKGQTFQT